MHLLFLHQQYPLLDITFIWIYNSIKSSPVRLISPFQAQLTHKTSNKGMDSFSKRTLLYKCSISSLLSKEERGWIDFFNYIQRQEAE